MVQHFDGGSWPQYDSIAEEAGPGTKVWRRKLAPVRQYGGGNLPWYDMQYGGGHLRTAANLRCVPSHSPITLPLLRREHTLTYTHA